MAVARVEAAAPVGRGSNVDFVSQGDEPTLLTRHLRQWLGKWPAESELDIEESSGRIRPGWDGAIHPVIGVASPSGAVLSVPPRHAKHLRRRYAELGGLDALAVEIPAAVGFPRSSWYRAVFRWTTSPSPLPEVGEWVKADDPRLPPWLRPFGGDVLIAFDPETGDYLAGVGIKRHDRFGREIAVGTEEHARGRGLARRLVAQAARRILDDGAIPTYMHAFTNHASARVAEAAGFPDRGWTSFGLTEEPLAGDEAASGDNA